MNTHISYFINVNVGLALWQLTAHVTVCSPGLHASRRYASCLMQALVMIEVY